MTSLFRSNIQAIAGYVPGEQPQTDDWIKINTNENPYPPSPKVVEAIQKAATGRLNVYPDPTARRFREVAAQLFGVSPDWILPANGSDENLTVLLRSFCDDNDVIGYPYPSYILYETLARIQNCRCDRLLLNKQFQWNPAAAADFRKRCKLFFVPNPNSPTGNRWSSDQLAQLIPDAGLLILDEAYGDFPEPAHRGELLTDPRFADRIVMTRSLSKSYSLAGLRFGFSVADPELTSGMNKVKDSYNCDSLAIAAATAALLDQDWMLQNRDRIRRTRQRLQQALQQMGFNVSESEANFVWCTHPSGQHRQIYEQLKANRILVRLMIFDGSDAVPEGLRITIGTDEQIDRAIEQMQKIVSEI